MQFSQSDSAFSLWTRRESCKNINSDFGLLLEKKQKHPPASVGRCQLYPALVRAGCYCEAFSEQWTQKPFQARQRREDSLALANNHSWPTPSGIGGTGPKLGGGGVTYPRDDCMRKIWRNCYMFGTKPFSGDWKIIAGFHDADRPVLADWHLCRSRVGGGREGLTSGLPLGSPPPYTSHVVTRIGMQD